MFNPFVLTISRYFADIAQNKIKSIKGLRHLKHLRKVDLGANRIRVMEEIELEGLVNLEELWLGKNKIEKIEGLSRVSARGYLSLLVAVLLFKSP